jgi:hypothetical protein
MLGRQLLGSALVSLIEGQPNLAPKSDRHIFFRQTPTHDPIAHTDCTHKIARVQLVIAHPNLDASGAIGPRVVRCDRAKRSGSGRYIPFHNRDVHQIGPGLIR